MSTTFAEHVRQLQERYETAIGLQADIDGILLHSGLEKYYFADDQSAPFRLFGHFAQWLPVDRPGQLILIRPGRKPRYFQVIPPDFWYDQTVDNAGWWADCFEITVLSDEQLVAEHLPAADTLAFLGEDETLAEELGIRPESINNRSLLNYLDYFRAYKTHHEIEQIRSANQLALEGHAAACDCFLNGGNEFEIHLAYLSACGITESECPYPNIVALDRKASILHYQNRNRNGIGNKSQVLLIDAGCRINNYCSDITRTTVKDSCPAVFRDIVRGVDELEQQLVGKVKVGSSYIELHREALSALAELAGRLGLIRCGVEQAMSLGMPQLFMPHGVGHLLGVQVHDVGGHLASPDGGSAPPPPEYPFLRNTRIMTDSMVFTVEPGFYFIPMLLDPERTTPRGKELNWSLIDQLLPLGGVRIEDNVLVTPAGPVNLTRQ